MDLSEIERQRCLDNTLLALASFKVSSIFFVPPRDKLKTIVDSVSNLLSSSNPSYVYGVDAGGTRGGLVVFC